MAAVLARPQVVTKSTSAAEVAQKFADAGIDIGARIEAPELSHVNFVNTIWTTAQQNQAWNQVTVESKSNAIEAKAAQNQKEGYWAGQTAPQTERNRRNPPSRSRPDQT